jgi:hypothetical protein
MNKEDRKKLNSENCGSVKVEKVTACYSLCATCNNITWL